MNFSKDDVYAACRLVAHNYGFDPDLIFAICLQEGAKHGNDFEPDIARLEEGFYLKYVEPKQNLATTSEVLLSASYGVMQMMGESLRELGFFDWYFANQGVSMQMLLNNGLSEYCIPSALDWYCVNLNVMVEWGTKWFKRKYDAANGNITQALQAWNGGGNPLYASQVLQRQANVKRNVY
jgi:hypothetical protein